MPHTPSAVEDVAVPGTQVVATQLPGWDADPLPSDWERLRHTIKRLYVDENKTMKETIVILEREYDLRATVKTFKNRIRKWILDKRTKEAEAVAVLKLKKERDAMGKASVFKVRGKPVKIEDVLRYFMRKGVTNLEAEDQYPATPPDVECWTPLSSPVSSPLLRFKSRQVAPEEHLLLKPGPLEGQNGTLSDNSLTRPLEYKEHVAYKQSCLSVDQIRGSPFLCEMQSHNIHSPHLPLQFSASAKLFPAIRAYYSSSIKTELFILSGHGDLLNFDLAKEDINLSLFCSLCYAGASLFDSQSFDEGGKCFSEAFSIFESLLGSQDARTLPCILDTLIALIRKGYIGLVYILRRYAYDLARLQLPREHPLLEIWARLAPLHGLDFEYAIIGALKCVCDTLAASLGQFHRTTIFCYVSFLRRVMISDHSAIQLLHSLLVQGTNVLGISDIRVLDIKFEYGSALLDQNREDEAIAIFEEIYTTCKTTGNSALEISSLGLLADCQYSRGKFVEAESRLRQAVRRNEEVFGKSDQVTLKLKSRLKSWMCKWGRTSNAETPKQCNFQPTEPEDSDEDYFDQEDSVGEDVNDDFLHWNISDDHKRESSSATPIPFELHGINTKFDMPSLRPAFMPALVAIDGGSLEEWSDDETEHCGSDYRYSTPPVGTNFIGACSVPMDGSQPLETQRLNLSPLKRILVERIMEEFWVIFRQQWASNLTKHVESPSSSSPNTTRATGVNATSGHHPDTQIPSKKRTLSNRDDNQEEAGEDGNPKRPRQGSILVDDDFARLLACPYRKHNPRTYGITKWQSCALTAYPSISRLKEHLYRRHKIGLRCNRCWATFSSQDLLDTHQRMTASCDLRPKQDSEGITSSMMARIKCRKKVLANQSEAEKWYFEPIQEHQILSPNSQDLASYETYCQQELPRIFRGRLETAVNEGAQQIEEEIKSRLVEMIKDCHDQVFQTYQSKFGLHGSSAGGPNNMREMEPKARHFPGTPLTTYFQRPPLQDPNYTIPDVLEIQRQNIIRAPGLQGQYSDSGYNSMFGSQPSTQSQDTFKPPTLQGQYLNHGYSMENSQPSAQQQHTSPMSQLQGQYLDHGYSNVFSTQHSAETQDYNTGSHFCFCTDCTKTCSCLCHSTEDISTGWPGIIGNTEGLVIPMSHLGNNSMNALNDTFDLAPTTETSANNNSNLPVAIDDNPLELSEEASNRSFSAWRPSKTSPEWPDRV